MAIRKLGIASRAYRHVTRYRQILGVLFKYGFGGVVDSLHIAHYLEIGLQLVSRERRERVETLTTPQRVRMVLEELGPTFIKLGQVLSTRPDLIPPDFVVELTKLQQEVPPFPAEEARAIIEEDLRRPVDEVFQTFDDQCIAAASIGQVHRARLRDGEEVVVKVQRPHIHRQIEIDLEILLHLATLAEHHVEELQRFRPSRIVEEFSRTIERELDYHIEARHVERFARQFARNETVYVPKVFKEASSGRVLTLEYVNVIPATDVTALVAKGLDPKLIAQRATVLTLDQIFVHGFFHADPHPGNAFVLPGNVICLLDFGMMGRLDRQAREDFADLIYAVAQRDAGATAGALLRLCEHDETVEPDRARLERDLAEFIDLQIPAELRDLHFGRMLSDLLRLVGEHHLFIPPDLVTMMKAAATAERLVSRLDPDLNVIEEAAPYVRNLKIERIKPLRVWHDMLETGGDLLRVAQEIPGGIRDLLRLSKRGQLQIGFEHRGLKHLQDTLERIANRVSFAIVVAALVVGSSLIVHSGVPPTWNDIPIIGLVGFVVAGMMGFALLIAMLRHGRL